MKTSGIFLVLLALFLVGCSKDDAAASKVAAATSKPRTQVYDDSADGSKQIADAVAIAAKSDKHVLLQFGGNWCIPCLKLHDLLETNKGLSEVLTANYITVPISYNDENKHLVDKYHAMDLGVPFIVILDRSGKHLTTSGTQDFEEAGHHNPEKVLAFLNTWTPKALKAKPMAQWVQEFVDKPDTDDSRDELEQLRGNPAESVPALINVITSSHDTKGATNDQRIRAYRALGELGPEAKSAVPTLTAQFTKDNGMIQFAAVTLPKLGPEAKAAVPALNAILNDSELTPVAQEPTERSDPRSWLLYNAADCLSHLDPANPELLQTMLVWLKSKNVFCRRVAPSVLAELGPHAKSAVPALIEASSDGDQTVRQKAKDAIAAIDVGDASSVKVQ